MKRPCPYPHIVTTKVPHGEARVVRFGTFRRQDDCRTVQRFLCKECGRTFSTATTSDAYRQHRRRINRLTWRLFFLKVNMRGAAREFKINRTTLARKLQYHAVRGRRYLAAFRPTDLRAVHFDEMQSSVHTKCKPVSIPLVVARPSRHILAVGVASMPAQHPLRAISLRKYGPRADERAAVIARVLRRIGPMLREGGVITTDMAPRYPPLIKSHVPQAVHQVFRSRRAAATGQGEMKKIGGDPLFYLNHTAAMIRDGTSRLVRRTWANSKRQDRLEDHLVVFAHYFNTVYLPRQQ